MAPTVEKLRIPRMKLGEGPHWDAASRSLYMVDVPEGALVRYDLETNETYSVKLGLGMPYASFIIPVAGSKGEFIVGSVLSLYLVKWDGCSDKLDGIENLCTVEGDSKIHRINDAKCDSTGRLWFGTICLDHSDKGNLYSFTEEEGCQKHASGIKCSNGLTWDPEETKLYYIDTFAGSVDVFRYDKAGVVENRRVFFDFEENGTSGYPDGMTIDKDGNLWVACFTGNQVIKIDGKSGELLEAVTIPTTQVTSLAWGGPTLEDLYVTSGNMDSPALKKDEGGDNAGCTYRIVGLSTSGLPMREFKL